MRWSRLPLCVAVLTAAAAASALPGCSSDEAAAPSGLRCGPGTGEVAGECVAGAIGEDGGAGSDGGPTTTGDGGALRCGAGTLEVNGECVVASTAPVTAPAGPTLAAGAQTVCAVTTSGGVKCWGEGSSGQLGDGLQRQSGTVVITSTAEPDGGIGAPLTNVKSVAVGNANGCALTQAGAVYCWGESSGLGLGAYDDAYTARLIPSLASRVSRLAMGYGHACVIVDGTVKCWGDNSSGEAAQPPSQDGTYVPFDVAGLPGPAVELSLGQRHTCATLQSGKVFCWGDNEDGKLGDGTTAQSNAPKEPVLVNVTGGIGKVIATYDSTFVLGGAGAVFATGTNNYGELGLGNDEGAFVPTVAPLFTGATSVASGRNFSCALFSGTVRCVGRNRTGELGDGTKTDKVLAVVDAQGLTDATELVAGEGFACAKRSGGEIRCWGSNDSGELGIGFSRTQATPFPLSASYAHMAAGNSVGCGITAAGALRCAGYDSGGLGTGTATYVTLPTPATVSGLSTGVTAVTVGQDFACALHSGAAKCWGQNGGGQLGTGGNTASLSPAQVTGLDANVTDIAAGRQGFACAVQSGAAKCWGLNSQGQLGNGSNATSSTPVQVTGLDSGVTRVCASSQFACAVQGGAVKCWGQNYSGVLASKNTSNVPFAIAALDSGVTHVACGGDFACVIQTGAVKCWGGNGYGQLGDGGTSATPTPATVSGLASGATLLAAGDNHACAYDGTSLRCWGYSQQGAIGVPGPNRSTPVVVPGVSGLISLSAGRASTMASSATATWAWGDNRYQQLHTQVPTQSLVPVAVVGF